MSAEPSYPGVAPPPSGVIPDLAHPPDAGRALLLVWVTVCDVLATVFFLTRVYVKIWVTRKILIEDGTCTIAWALMLLYSATVYLMAHHGEGHHAWDVSREAYSQILKWLYAGSIVYCPTAYFTKVTLLLLIARVFAVRECVANSIHIFIFALLVAYLPIQIAKTVVCTPVRAYWDSSVHGTCLNQRKIFLSDISLAIFTDFIILLIPVPLTWSLRTPIRKKIKIVALLSAGGIATAVTVFRLYLAINFVHSTDVTSDFVAQNITVMIEVTIGLICSCIPAASILIRHCWPTRPSVRPNCPRSSWRGWGPNETRATISSPMSTMRSPPVNFEVEPAILSRHPGQITRDETKETDYDHLFNGWANSVSSREGRRDGWLGPR
ncbi:hypothetical protein BKA67DRAFT_527584 [Truncatella angustata]|uniref:Rhodopsin domain-containing protein n=1 Tax=Truncatella angustata TaxID=152316 RepID=A0A9P8UAQ7_9PEZI|nr:uncharacterized protein BKA67DRAFT_527584 [Truncatella angustata]KAH6645092.1 hypothetical protein BKA67DRAFT_527584 [Truncatella angustata]